MLHQTLVTSGSKIIKITDWYWISGAGHNTDEPSLDHKIMLVEQSQSKSVLDSINGKLSLDYGEGDSVPDYRKHN